jgi:hypothetical protein
MIHISSRLTYIYKRIIPTAVILLVLFAIYGVVQLFKYGATDLAIFIIVIIAFLTYIVLNNLLRLKRVSYDKEFIYVDNFKKNDKVGINKIAVIKRKHFYFYEIKFKEDRLFGKSVVFMPKFSEMAITLFLSDPKSIRMLEEIIQE